MHEFEINGGPKGNIFNMDTAATPLINGINPDLGHNTINVGSGDLSALSGEVEVSSGHRSLTITARHFTNLPAKGSLPSLFFLNLFVPYRLLRLAQLSSILPGKRHSTAVMLGGKKMVPKMIALGVPTIIDDGPLAELLAARGWRSRYSAATRSRSKGVYNGSK